MGKENHTLQAARRERGIFEFLMMKTAHCLSDALAMPRIVRDHAVSGIESGMFFHHKKCNVVFSTG